MTTATFRTRLLAAQELALETLLHLAQDLSHPAQARLAATALLRTKLPDAGDEAEDQAVEADEIERPTPSALPAARTKETPPHPPRRQIRPDPHQPVAPSAESADTSSLSPLAAALDRITRAPSGIAGALLAASGAPNGQSAVPMRLAG